MLTTNTTIHSDYLVLYGLVWKDNHKTFGYKLSNWHDYVYFDLPDGFTVVFESDDKAGCERVLKSLTD